MFYTIKHVASTEQLRRVYDFAASILDLPTGIHTLEFYEAQFTETPRLLVFAEHSGPTDTDGGRICGCVLACIEGDHILVGAVAVAPDARRQGIGAAMMREIEMQALSLDQHALILGAREAAEPFYLSCGYRPNLFVQVPGGDLVGQLKALNQSYEVIWEWEDPDTSKLMLRLPHIDKDLQQQYAQAFPTCHTQTVFTKNLP